MANEKATKLAQQIIEDLHGAGYYADPKILAGILAGAQGTAEQDEGAAISLLRFLLRRYARNCANEQEIEELAKHLEG